MTYSELLRPWCIVRPYQERLIVVARFRRRNDAVAYLELLQSLVKNVTFVIIFDIQGARKLPAK